MPDVLFSPAEILRTARAGGYAIPALNTVGLEMTRGAIAAAERCKSPLILQTSVKTVKYYEARILYRVIADLCAGTTVPIALHLDHCKDLDVMAACLDAGWTSVMIDAGDLPLDENIDRTRVAVAMAKPRGAAVEGELGEIGGIEDGVGGAGSQCVLVADVKRYAEETGIDMLAVGIGTFHGRGNTLPCLRFDLLEQVARETTLPLVLHGGTGIAGPDIRRAIALGVAKINVSTELKESTQAAVERVLADGRYEPIRAMEQIEQASNQLATGKFVEFGSAGRAARQA